MVDSLEKAIERANAGYVYTDTFEEAIESLEMTARFLEESEHDPRRWKWATIALYLAIQNLTVLVLKNSWDVGTQHRDVRNEKLEAHHNLHRAIASGDKAAIDEASARDRAAMGKNKLDGFDWLYKRIKDRDHWAMEYLGNDKVFEPGGTCDDSMERLKDIRDDYMHFQHGLRFHCISSLALIAVDGLSVIEFLLSRDKLIGWRPDNEHKARAEVAFENAKAAASRLAERYPLPASDETMPSDSAASFVLQMIEKAVAELRDEDASGERQDA